MLTTLFFDVLWSRIDSQTFWHDTNLDMFSKTTMHLSFLPCYRQITLHSFFVLCVFNLLLTHFFWFFKICFLMFCGDTCFLVSFAWHFICYLMAPKALRLWTLEDGNTSYMSITQSSSSGSWQHSRREAKSARAPGSPGKPPDSACDSDVWEGAW